MKHIDFHPDVILAVTDKSDGNIDYRYGGKRQVDANRKKIYDLLKMHPTQIIEGEQIHFSRILHLYEENAKMWRGMSVTGVDGFVTDQNDISLMMRVADCATMAFYDPAHKALGLLHAGWKGIKSGVHKEGLLFMQQKYKSNLEDIIVWLGPCAQKCCYTQEEQPEQVGDEAWKPFISKKKGLWCIDMVGFLQNDLVKEGILAANIKVSEDCTIDSPDYFSHRSSKTNEADLGRFAVIAQLKAK